MFAQASLPASSPRRATGKPSPAFFVETGGLVVFVLVIIASYAHHHVTEIWNSRLVLLSWTCALALLALLEIRTFKGERIVPDVPVLLALALVFPPALGASIAFLGSASVTEFRTMNMFALSINNRASTALGVFMASFVARPIVGESGLGSLLVAGIVAWLTWTLGNYTVTTVSIAIHRKVNVQRALSKLRPARLGDYAVVNVAWCLLAWVIVFLYGLMDLWALAALTILALPLRQVLLRGESAVKAEREVDRQRQVISALSRRIVDERRDERLRVAGELHDEVVPPLFKVSLLSHVIRRSLPAVAPDLISDCDELSNASDCASAITRDFIRRLRESPVSTGGVTSAMEHLLEDLRLHSEATFAATIPQTLVDLPTELQLVLYQVAREALSNAARHSKATEISLRVMAEPETVSLVVADNGIGFDPWMARGSHFGILIMQERSASVGGETYIDSTLGSGTTITAHFPRAVNSHKPSPDRPLGDQEEGSSTVRPSRMRRQRAADP